MSEAIVIPVLCRLWFEDGVWNAIAEQTAVAVFGPTREQADAILKEALKLHFDEIHRLGHLELELRKMRDQSVTLEPDELAGKTMEYILHQVIRPSNAEALVA